MAMGMKKGRRLTTCLLLVGDEECKTKKGSERLLSDGETRQWEVFVGWLEDQIADCQLAPDQAKRRTDRNRASSQHDQGPRLEGRGRRLKEGKGISPSQPSLSLIDLPHTLD